MEDKNKLIESFPLLKNMMDLQEVFWVNEQIHESQKALKILSLSFEDMLDASERLNRFAPFIESAFEETQNSKGIIESPLVEIPSMKKAMNQQFQANIQGKLLLKCDNALPISGSIKARGGIYEVLKHAEDLALSQGKIDLQKDYSQLASQEMKEFFSNYHIAVGSTGNLGLSIGIISAKLGFKVSVHMSADAKQWKKDLLRSKGVEVIEYVQDYSKAVEEGRRLSQLDPNSYFVDDENSVNLFLGYSVAALRLKNQLIEMGITVDKEHPLFVYLPCGVGGGPGGVAFGLKQIFGDCVHFFFAEPVHSPCMLLGMMTKTHDQYAVQDFGIDNKTIADGLAVGRASGFVGKTLEHLVSGCYTMEDETMLMLLAMLDKTENIRLEPSALAGFGGLLQEWNQDYQNYLAQNKIDSSSIIHLAWATGGSMVPTQIMQMDIEKGNSLLNKNGL